MADIKNTQKFDKASQEDVLKQVSENLIDIESQIPAGGHQIITYEKGKYEHIGIITNFTTPIRVDKKGEFRPSSVSIDSKGSYTVNTAVPYTEAVENTRYPCGDYTLMVGNQYNLNVGAGGAYISTLGNMQISCDGRNTIVGNAELNLSTDGNLNIRASENISIVSRNSLNLSAPDQVVVDCNLGVAKNAIINGCAFIDGETYVNHITCPVETQYTGGGIGSFGQLMPSGGGSGGNIMIGWADVSYIKTLYNSIGASKSPWSMPDMIPVFALPSSSTGLASTKGFTSGKNPESSIFCYPHQHPFNNIPLSFSSGNGKMREKAGAALNGGAIGTASPIKHGQKSVG